MSEGLLIVAKQNILSQNLLQSMNFEKSNSNSYSSLILFSFFRPIQGKISLKQSLRAE